ncbi:MAG: MFS transporter [Spirochaetales bacterium]|nr:MFS transporter [Spirochaetales bacterium]
MAGSLPCAADLPSPTWRKKFYPIWAGQFFSLFSSGIVQFAIVWWLTRETGSAKILSLGTILILLPESLLNPLIGAIVDRSARKAVLILADSLTAALSLVLAGIFLWGSVVVWQVLTVVFLRSLSGCFHHNAMISATSLMVPKDRLIGIAGLNQTLRGLVMFATPPLGALLMGRSGFGIIMLLDVAGALIALVPLCLIGIGEEADGWDKAGKGWDKDLPAKVAEGFRYIRAWKGAAGMLAISTIVNFVFQPVFTMSPIFVMRVLAGNEMDFGILGGVTGFGFMAGGMAIGILKGHKKKMITSLAGILGAGSAVLATGLLPAESFPLILICFFFAGSMIPVCMSPVQALIQGSVPAGLQGRVFSIMSSLSTLAAPVSLALAGILFDLASPRLWYIAGGGLVLAAGCTGFLIPRIRDLGEGPGYCPRASLSIR